MEWSTLSIKILGNSTPNNSDLDKISQGIKKSIFGNEKDSLWDVKKKKKKIANQIFSSKQRYIVKYLLYQNVLKRKLNEDTISSGAD